jgi:hypothetical protein
MSLVLCRLIKLRGSFDKNIFRADLGAKELFSGVVEYLAGG